MLCYSVCHEIQFIISTSSAVIEKIHQVSDGLARVATVHTIRGTFKRVVNKLCLLPKDDSQYFLCYNPFVHSSELSTDMCEDGWTVPLHEVKYLVSEPAVLVNVVHDLRQVVYYVNYSCV